MTHFLYLFASLYHWISSCIPGVGKLWPVGKSSPSPVSVNKVHWKTACLFVHILSTAAFVPQQQS